MSDIDIWSSDIVSLSEGVSIQGDALFDQVSDQKIRINSSASILLRSLGNKKRFKKF